MGKRDAGAIAAKKMRDKELTKVCWFLTSNESVSEAKVEGGYISKCCEGTSKK